MKKSDNTDHNSEVAPRSDPARAIPETNAGYYYDDATGYEIFEDDEGDEDDIAPEPAPAKPEGRERFRPVFDFGNTIAETAACLLVEMERREVIPTLISWLPDDGDRRGHRALEMLQFLKEHELTHRAQLFLYLRLKGIVPATTRRRLAKARA